MIDYRGKQLTLIGGPLLDPFSAAFQGELMLPGAQVMQKALCHKAHLAAIAGSVSHGFSSVPVLQQLRTPDLSQDSQNFMHARGDCNRDQPTLLVFKGSTKLSQPTLQQSLKP